MLLLVAVTAATLSDRANGHARLEECRLGFCHGVFTEVEDRCRKHSIGMAFGHAFDEMVECRCDECRKSLEDTLD